MPSEIRSAASLVRRRPRRRARRCRDRTSRYLCRFPPCWCFHIRFRWLHRCRRVRRYPLNDPCTVNACIWATPSAETATRFYPRCVSSSRRSRRCPVRQPPRPDRSASGLGYRVPVLCSTFPTFWRFCLNRLPFSIAVPLWRDGR